jgi:hypothetical protein
VIVANNKHDNAKGTHQYGGTAIVTTNSLHHLVYSKGQDMVGLGRWSWQMIQGKDGKVIKVVSACAPHHPP